MPIEEVKNKEKMRVLLQDEYNSDPVRLLLSAEQVALLEYLIENNWVSATLTVVDDDEAWHEVI